MLVSSCLPSGCFPPAHVGCGGCPECGCSPGTVSWAGLLAQDPGPPQWRLLLEWEVHQLHWLLPLDPQGLSQPGEIIFTPWAAPCLAWCARNAGFTCPLPLEALRVPGWCLQLVAEAASSPSLWGRFCSHITLSWLQHGDTHQPFHLQLTKLFKIHLFVYLNQHLRCGALWDLMFIPASPTPQLWHCHCCRNYLSAGKLLEGALRSWGQEPRAHKPSVVLCLLVLIFSPSFSTAGRQRSCAGRTLSAGCSLHQRTPCDQR